MKVLISTSAADPLKKLVKGATFNHISRSYKIGGNTDTEGTVVKRLCKITDVTVSKQSGKVTKLELSGKGLVPWTATTAAFLKSLAAPLPAKGERGIAFRFVSATAPTKAPSKAPVGEDAKLVPGLKFTLIRRAFKVSGGFDKEGFVSRVKCTIVSVQGTMLKCSGEGLSPFSLSKAAFLKHLAAPMPAKGKRGEAIRLISSRGVAKADQDDVKALAAQIKVIVKQIADLEKQKKALERKLG